MSEEILKALTQLFAIITKQDGGVTDRERLFVIHFFQTELDYDSLGEYVRLYDAYSGYGRHDSASSRPTSVKDSVRTLGICKKINQTLTQKQKVVVLIKLLELIGSGETFSPQRKDIINTVASVFNVDRYEYNTIEKFVLKKDIASLDVRDILLVDGNATRTGQYALHLQSDISGMLVFLRVRSVDMYFVKYLGDQANILNGLVMQANYVYLFTHGSTIKGQSGDALYYSDLAAHFNDQLQTARLSFNATLGEVKFSSGTFGLHGMCIAEGAGKLVGIMGASGAGKSTLLNVLAGLIEPEKVEIRINGLDLHHKKERIHGVIGYVSQDDLLIEELTVYQNLYYNAKLSLADLSEDELHKRVMSMLRTLGLDQRKDLRVGNALTKTISGGQRKRLNIALELIREPAILFLDEPTSGLSSRDSENIVDLLKELSLKGKLVFAVIHQPSSDIFKMFDKMIIMDVGGYPAYYGTPVEAIGYFKRATHQIDSNRGHCHTCGNVNPEQIFNIMEARVVDEYGQPTTRRKVLPPQWYELFKKHFTVMPIPDVMEQPPRTLNLPGKRRQVGIFALRDLLAKVSNKQYLLINLLEAPLLAFLLAFIIKYNSGPGQSGYMFRYNDNFPAYILISIIVALFMGLSVSAEEIIRDRKILKRESFLHLSWNSYLLSKLMILFTLSAIQTLSFVIVGNTLLSIEWRMLLPFWFVLFSVSCMSNVMGLNISSAFQSAVTVYILIPLLLIPQMILSGLLFRFEKLNETISARDKVPLVADLMVSRWAYEAMAVYHFVNNSYEQPFYRIDKIKSQAHFKSTYLADALSEKMRFVEQNLNSEDDAVSRIVQRNLQVIFAHMKNEPGADPLQESPAFAEQTSAMASPEFKTVFERWLAGYKRRYRDIYNNAVAAREKLAVEMASANEGLFDVTQYKNGYYNESLADLLTNVSEKNRIIDYDGKLVQLVDPVFRDPVPVHFLDYRAHFFAPRKNFFGNLIHTYWFNVSVIWMMTFALYGALYYEVLKRAISKLIRKRK